MARNNPSNPYTRDPAHTAKDVPLPVQKAKVMAAGDHPEDDAFHTVKIRIYGDNAPYIAPVLTPVPGSVWIPEEGTDVAVIFGDSNKPWVIGSWYALDRVEDGEVDLPDYEEGDIRFGNSTGSHVTVDSEGGVTIGTAEGDFVVDGSKIKKSKYIDEDAQDAVGNILSSDFTYDDVNDFIDLSFDPATQTELDTHSADVDAHHARYSDEEVEDVVAGLIAGGVNVTATYDDVGGTLTIDTSALNEEEVEDAVSALLTGGTGVSLSYDDVNDALTINGFSGDHADLTNIQSDQHHVKTQSSDIDSTNWNDYEIQKNGTDGTGIINFKT